MQSIDRDTLVARANRLFAEAYRGQLAPVVDVGPLLDYYQRYPLARRLVSRLHRDLESGHGRAFWFAETALRAHWALLGSAASDTQAALARAMRVGFYEAGIVIRALEATGAVRREHRSGFDVYARNPSVGNHEIGGRFLMAFLLLGEVAGHTPPRDRGGARTLAKKGPAQGGVLPTQK